MPNTSAARYKFISHALNADGPFRPVVSDDGMNSATLSGLSYLVRYPRESDAKFARRNQVAFFSSPLLRACARFVGYLSMRQPVRDAANDAYTKIADDVDGKGNSVDVFLNQFCLEAKARGSMLLLVDMPRDVPATLGDQIALRRLPFWSSILPEHVTDYGLGQDGRFDWVEFSGTCEKDSGEVVPCFWRFDRKGWTAKDNEQRNIVPPGTHTLGVCPILIFTESGDFPHFGSFSAIADIAKRLFNVDSELDEILRAQTFSLLTMQVPDGSTDAQKIAAAQVAGETIGTSNLMVHSGSTPQFIAPPDGPARIYLDRVKQLQAVIDEIGLNVATVAQQESGIAMQMRFQAINGELSKFAGRMEDLERRAWELTRQWLGMDQSTTVQWPRDFNISEVKTEMEILTDMQANNMPPVVVAHQKKRIVALQFGGLDQELKDEAALAIDEQTLEPKTSLENNP